MQKTRVAVRGAAGRMGKEAVSAIREADDLELVCELDLGDDPASRFRENAVEVALDFTEPKALGEGVPAMLRAGASVVIGTSGVTKTQQEAWRELCADTGTAVLVVPNFCIGVLLMQSFAEQAARWFPDVEIIELHHEKKVDSPSGTAADTARRIARARNEEDCVANASLDKSEFRGGRVAGISIHSIRLPGLLAHQELLFGGKGEILTLRHDSLDRKAFMPGVLLALRAVRELQGVSVGLESVLPGISG